MEGSQDSPQQLYNLTYALHGDQYTYREGPWKFGAIQEFIADELYGLDVEHISIDPAD